MAYPRRALTDLDLRHIAEDRSISESYPLLTLLAKNLTTLQAGGALLPDLIEFYLWLHNDLRCTLSEDETRTRSLGQVVRDFGNGHHISLFKKVKGK